ncbi:MAG: ribonuclease HII [Candidatus Thorarchaeota archaeon]|nr:MAG: ribonuclease HII [Candidatus Thorarchaeota archaeon]
MRETGPGLRGTAGIDEAGRGPMIGPLVVCGVLVQPESITELQRIGVRDSKTLTPKRRVELAKKIRGIADRISLRRISAARIDDLRAKGVTMNEIEVRAFASILRSLRPDKAFIDAADINAQRFGVLIGEKSGLVSLGCSIVSEHFADSTYPAVSAASIVAKVDRDNRIRELQKNYGAFGSGYPSDSRTVQFVRSFVVDKTPLPAIVRKSWKSVERILRESKGEQMRLG